MGYRTRVRGPDIVPAAHRAAVAAVPARGDGRRHRPARHLRRAGIVAAAVLATGASVFAALARESVPATYPSSVPATSEASGPTVQPAVRFATVSVIVDSGATPLAAYQFELAAEVGQVKIVGIEGGEHAAFAAPPYYDPAAMMNNRVIIAAFSTGRDLPKGKTRVATVHVQITGDTGPRYAAKLIVAGSDNGTPIGEATIRVEDGSGS